MSSTTRHSIPHPRDAGRRVRVLVDRADEGPRPWVLVAHGFKGFASWGFFPELARRLADAGLVAMRVDFSGNGVGEDGETFSDEVGFERDTFSRQLEDLVSVIEWVQAGGAGAVDLQRRAILGHSRGGGVALVHAAERADYAAVVTWASIESFERVDEVTKREWRERGFLPVPNARTGQVHRLGVDLLDDVEQNRERLDILAACTRLRSPTLVVHGSDDAAVPITAAERILAALPPAHRSHLWMEGSGHTFGAGHPFSEAGPELEAVLEATLDHLVRHLGPHESSPD